VVAGFEHLAFVCNGCGECCRRLRVAITHRDLGRLVRQLELPPAELVGWLEPEQVDFESESASFVALPAGPRLMVLAQAHGACRFLSADGRCGAYSARPLDCRSYPFVLERDDERRVTRLALFEPAGCGDRGSSAMSLDELTREDDERSAALADYVTLVGRWNRLARHRARLRHRARGEGDFLAFLLTSCS